jgi:hypothetical protein
MHEVLTHRSEPQQDSQVLALVTDLHREARSVMDCAMSVVRGSAERPQQSELSAFVRNLCEVMAGAQQQHAAYVAQMMEQCCAAHVVSGRIVELVEQRLSQPVQMLPAPASPLQIEIRQAPPQVVEIPQQVVALQQQQVQAVPQLCADDIVARVIEMMSRNFEYQNRMLETTQRTMLAIADSSRDVSKQIVEGANASQQLLLTNFTTSVDKALNLQVKPMAQLCPVLRQCIVSLAATREVFSSISQPPLSGGPHHGATVVEVRDKSVSPAPPASSTIPPVVRASEAASRVNEGEESALDTDTGKRMRSPTVKSHRPEQSVTAEHRDPDRSPSPEPRDPTSH